MMRLLSAAGIILFSCLPLFCQPAFDAAWIKPDRPGDVRGSTFQFTPGGGVAVKNGTLRDLIEMAYHVRDFEILGGPGWLNSDRYDVSAKTESANPQEPISQTRQRLQALLAERFHLKVHRETKELPMYTLVPGKNGSKLKEGAPSNLPGNAGIRTGCGQMTGTRASMADLVVMLSRQLHRSVLDQTSLTGRYDFTIEWAPEPGSCREPAAAPVDGLSIFGALQEQLGLKLESTKGPVDVIVVDHAEKADAN